MKQLKQFASIGLLVWYGAILWHNTEPIHTDDINRHHHHIDGHHHGLLSIIVDLIHDLHHTQFEFDRNELCLISDFSPSLKKLGPKNSEFKGLLLQDYFIILVLEGGAVEPNDPSVNLPLSRLAFNLTRRGPPTTS